MPTSTIITSTAKNLTVTVDTVNTLAASAKTVLPLFSWFDSLPSLIRAVIGSLCAAAVVYILTQLVKFGVFLNKTYKKERDKEKIFLYHVYKNFANEESFYLSVRGYVYIIWKALQKTINAILWTIYIVFLYLFNTKNYYECIYAVFTYVVFWSASKWLKDHGDKSMLKGVDPKLIEEYEENDKKQKEEKEKKKQEERNTLLKDLNITKEAPNAEKK